MMFWLLSCILIKNPNITSDCFQLDCDTGSPVKSISVFFEPDFIELNEEVICRSSQIFPFASSHFTWFQNGQLLSETKDKLLLSSPPFQSGDQIECHIEWLENSLQYAIGSGTLVIP